MDKKFKWFFVVAFFGLVLVCVYDSLFLSHLNRAAVKLGPATDHGLLAGYTMAKRGVPKPTDAELDSYARQAAQSLGDPGGIGFKMEWKNAFWAGWMKGD